MDALYMKFYVIWLVIRVLRVSYAKCDESRAPSTVESISKAEGKRFFVLAITTALTHWLMTGIIGVRIYVDNFAIEKDVTNSSVNFTIQNDEINSSIPNTGDYRVTPFTGFMIACTIYLPIVSWIVQIVYYGRFFYEIYSAIHQLNTGAKFMCIWNSDNCMQFFLLYV